MPLSAEQDPTVYGRESGRAARVCRREAARSVGLLALLAGAVLQFACGSAGDLELARDDDPPAEERFANYPVEGPGAATPCGWLPMPNGQTDYLPCPSTAARSPISDPPDQEYDDLVGPPPVDPRPDPPGDPPPY